MSAERIVAALEAIDPKIKEKYAIACKGIAEYEKDELLKAIGELKELQRPPIPEAFPIVNNRLNMPEIEYSNYERQTKPHQIRYHEFNG